MRAASDSGRWARRWWDARLPHPRKGFGSADVARICGVDQRTVQRWIQAGKLGALGSTDDAQFEARVPREWLITFLVRRMPYGFYPDQGELFDDID